MDEYLESVGAGQYVRQKEASRAGATPGAANPGGGRGEAKKGATTGIRKSSKQNGIDM